MRALGGMSTRLITTLYFFFWICFAAAIVFFGSSFGHSPWLMVGIALLVIFFVSGSIAHYVLSWKLRRDGKQPPSYFEFLIQTNKLEIVEFNRPIRVPSLVRILLGLVVVLVAIF
jgi:hypothetical protein